MLSQDRGAVVSEWGFHAVRSARSPRDQAVGLMLIERFRYAMSRLVIRKDLSLQNAKKPSMIHAGLFECVLQESVFAGNCSVFLTHFVFQDSVTPGVSLEAWNAEASSDHHVRSGLESGQVDLEISLD